MDTAEITVAGGRVAGERMDKRLAKRDKRQVSRARKALKLSEPDVRTPEQIEAARLASHTDFRLDKNPWPSLPSGPGAPERSDRFAVNPNYRCAATFTGALTRLVALLSDLR